MDNLTHIEFNNHRIAVVAADGTHWVAIKPLCTALGVHYKSQHEAISKDPDLSQLSSIQRTVGQDGKDREMFCLPYWMVYGYIFSIRSNSDDLRAYRMECYRILYDYFHRILAKRKRLLQERRDGKIRIAELEAKFSADEEYQELMSLRQFQKRVPHSLKKLDKGLQDDQMELDL